MNVNIRYLWLAIALSALIPTMSVLVPVLASSRDTLSITGNGDTASMALKATESNGNTENVDNFELTAANVLQIEEDDDVRITNDVNFDKARTVDVNDNEKAIDIDDDGNVDFDDYPQGTYVLRVITENGDRKLYEGIIVIGPENKDEVNKVIQKTIIEVIIDIDFDDDEPEPPTICYFDPMDEECDPDENGNCPPGWGHNDDDRCIPIGKCPEGYGRGEDDETGTCYKEDELQKCEDGSIRIPGDRCPPVRPIVDECKPNFELVDNKCIPITPVPEPITPLPYGDCTTDSVYNPETGQCDPIEVESEKPLPPTPELLPPTPLPPTPETLLGEPIETEEIPEVPEEEEEEEEEVEEEEPEEPEEEEPEEPEEEESGGDDEASFGN